MAESYTDFKKLSKKHTEKILIGEGDCRILARGDSEEIRIMVCSIVKTAQLGNKIKR